MSTNSNVLKFFRQSSFTPVYTRTAIESGAPLKKYSLRDLQDTAFENTSSFRYDQVGVGLKSTQQLNIDWSSFSNHVYFNSAEVVVNVGFDNIINGYPFDGTRKEYEVFLDKLSGFEKWLLDQFPKHKGYLYFSGSTGPTAGTFIQVNDFAGSEFPSISKNKSGKSIIDPNGKSFTIECQLFVPTIANDNQVIIQKLSGSDQGITLGLKGTASTSTVEVFFNICSGSTNNIVSASLEKGIFNHVVATYDRTQQDNKLYLYSNEILLTTSSNSVTIDNFDFILQPLYIGSGSTSLTPTGSFVPAQTLSGAIDELRIFHDVRTPIIQKTYGYKSIFADETLKLYYKFNEPETNFGQNNDDQINRIVLDSSGNSLHSFINEDGFSFTLRQSGALDNPMIHEKLNNSPILFPGHSEIISLNEELLTSASLYDIANPNLITKLIPKHYLLEGQAYEGFENEEGTILDSYEYDDEGIPGQGKLGSSQLLTSLLYVFARHFDELKQFVGAMGDMIFVNYDDYDTSPDQMLNFVANYYGISLPGMFADSEIKQFVDAEDMTRDFGFNDYSLQLVQNQIWRRILTNLNEIIRSKGTLHSIKSFIRTLGIDPDQNFRIREYGGRTFAALDNAREDKSTVTKMLDVTGSNTTFTLESSVLVAEQRIEPGYPYISATSNDVLLTSGSWTYEATYRFPNIRTYDDQSLARLCVTGSSLSAYGCTFNLIARPHETATSASIELYAKPAWGGTANAFSLVLSGVNIFDDERWLITFGRYRNDDISQDETNDVSSSYFLRAYRSNIEQLVQTYTTSSLVLETSDNDTTKNSLQTLDSTYNASGTIFVLGNTNQDFTLEFVTGTLEETTRFDGRISDIRFWSRALSTRDSEEHARNFKSLGVEEPNLNFNFEIYQTGSWERLRLDVSCDQNTITTDGIGQIQLFDYSQNEYHINGSNFEASTDVIKPQLHYYSIISPKFDESIEMNKVRIRGFSQLENARLFGAEVGEVYEVPVTEIVKDDPRLTIDISVIDALNEDIIRIFSTLRQLDNVIGNPELVFAEDYPGLDVLRNIYFNRLTDKVNLKGFFEFFKWFDVSVGSFIEQLIPRKTKFLGTNYVIESHMLERAKFQHRYEDVYLGFNTRKTLYSELPPVIVGTP